MIPAWVADYIGLPFKDFGRDRDGLDCWGLVRLVLKEIYGVETPSYLDGYGSALDRESVGAHILDTVSDPIWTEISPGEERAGDVIVTRVFRLPAHVGIVVDRGVMLHVHPGIDTAIEDYTRPKWRHVISGFYRISK